MDGGGQERESPSIGEALWAVVQPVLLEIFVKPDCDGEQYHPPCRNSWTVSASPFLSTEIKPVCYTRVHPLKGGLISNKGL